MKKFEKITKCCYMKLSRFLNNIFISKIIVLFVVWLIALIPVWIYILINWIASPETFWEGFAVLAICVLVLGLPQTIMIILGGALTIMIILDDL